MTIVFVSSLINEENAAKLLSIFDFGKEGKKLFFGDRYTNFRKADGTKAIATARTFSSLTTTLLLLSTLIT